MGPDAITRPSRVFYTAAVVADANHAVAPGAILLEAGANAKATPTLRVLAAGSPAEVASHPGADGASRIDLPTHAILPAFVNAHTHLDLTHVGYVAPVPEPERRFLSFIEVVRKSRALEDAAIRASVEAGVQACLEGGVVAVGDIAGATQAKPNLAAARALVQSDLGGACGGGVSFLEFFAIGSREDASRDFAQAAMAEALADDALKGRVGLSPHATNTVGPTTLRWALEMASVGRFPLCTHVAETVAERELITHARGPNRAFLEGLGLWNSALDHEFGQGRSPIAHLAWAIEGAKLESKPSWILAHCNDVSDADLDLLQALGTSVDLTVAYCPRAGEYFAAPDLLGPHRYREMLDRGINVALGTDSLINLSPIPGEEGTRLSPIWDARLLCRRDGVDPFTLLSLLTTRGACALAMDSNLFTFHGGIEPSPCAGLVAVDLSADSGTSTHLLAKAFTGNAPPRLL
jgi:cytosine/adenosine deaminase-related metal-dependent hydrolase